MNEPRLSRRQVIVGGTATVAAAAAVTAIAAKTTRSSSSSSPSSEGESQSAAVATTGSEATAPITIPPVSPTAAAPLTAPTTVPPTTLPAPGAPAAFINHGPVGSTIVALTYHAKGDNALSQRLLDLMKELQVTATIFGVGNWMKDNPSMGNHTWSHQPMRKLSAKKLLDEITGCAAVLTDLVGSPTRWFRPSGIEEPTDAILEQAGKAGYQVSVGYDVDSLDFQDPPVADIITNVTTVVTGGSIVSLHFGHEGTLKALPKIVDHIRGLGLTSGTVGQLLG
jgi:peptidoglycan/xylan/chitin deacetylase (PgdA/CDA1 family)